MQKYLFYPLGYFNQYCIIINIINIYFAAQIFPALAIGSLIVVPFRHVSILVFWGHTSLLLASPDSSCIIPAHSWSLPLLQGTLFFLWESDNRNRSGL